MTINQRFYNEFVGFFEEASNGKALIINDLRISAVFNIICGELLKPKWFVLKGDFSLTKVETNKIKIGGTIKTGKEIEDSTNKSVEIVVIKDGFDFFVRLSTVNDLKEGYLSNILNANPQLANW